MQLFSCLRAELGTSTTAWRFHATVSRNIRVATIESRMVEIDGLKDLKADVRSASKKRDKLIRTFPTDPEGVPRTPALAPATPATPAQTPAPARSLEGEFGDEENKHAFSAKEVSAFKRVMGDLEGAEERKRVGEKELEELVKEISIYRADPKNARFSRKEETEGKAQALAQQKEGEAGEGWEKWIEKIQN